MVFARPRNPAARALLAFAMVEAAGYLVGTAYSAYLVKEGTPVWGWAVILGMQGLDFASFVVIFVVWLFSPMGNISVPTSAGRLLSWARPCRCCS